MKKKVRTPILSNIHFAKSKKKQYKYIQEYRQAPFFEYKINEISINDYVYKHKFLYTNKY